MKEIEELWREVRDLSLGNSGRVERLDCPPNPIEFLRDFITPNKPCIISNAISHWPALSSWPNHSYLSQTLSAATISLHLTPTGAADALSPLHSSLCFASAHVQHVPFPEALSLISNSEPRKLVACAQQQNDCFHSEYSSLAADCDPDLGWATEAIGSEPEAEPEDKLEAEGSRISGLQISDKSQITNFSPSHCHFNCHVTQVKSHVAHISPSWQQDR